MRAILAGLLALATLGVPSSPALALADSDRAQSREEEDAVRGTMREDAQRRMRLGDPEAIEICEMLVDYIENTRWRSEAEVADQLEWAQNCASGNQPYSPPTYTREENAAYIDYKLEEAFSTFATLIKFLPYDGKGDPNAVFRSAESVRLECWSIRDRAKQVGDGAEGLVAYCEAVALLFQAQTIKPAKTAYYCQYFREADEDLRGRDSASSGFSAKIDDARPAIETQLAKPACADRG